MAIGPIETERSMGEAEQRKGAPRTPGGRKQCFETLVFIWSRQFYLSCPPCTDLSPGNVRAGCFLTHLHSLGLDRRDAAVGILVRTSSMGLSLGGSQCSSGPLLPSFDPRTAQIAFTLFPDELQVQELTCAESHGERVVRASVHLLPRVSPLPLRSGCAAGASWGRLGRGRALWAESFQVECAAPRRPSSRETGRCCTERTKKCDWLRKKFCQFNVWRQKKAQARGGWVVQSSK